MDITNAVVVLITAPSFEVARRLGRSLVERKLAASANIIHPISSIYAWKGEIHEHEEVMVIVKTRSELVEEALIPAVKSIHPYEVPGIVALPICAGSKSYLEWILAETEKISHA